MSKFVTLEPTYVQCMREEYTALLFERPGGGVDFFCSPSVNDAKNRPPPPPGAPLGFPRTGGEIEIHIVPANHPSPPQLPLCVYKYELGSCSGICVSRPLIGWYMCEQAFDWSSQLFCYSLVSSGGIQSSQLYIYFKGLL